MSKCGQKWFENRKQEEGKLCESNALPSILQWGETEWPSLDFPLSRLYGGWQFSLVPPITPSLSVNHHGVFIAELAEG